MRRRKRQRFLTLAFQAVILAMTATFVITQLRRAAKMQAENRSELATYDYAQNRWRMKVEEAGPR
jgi:hypothetical protein